MNCKEAIDSYSPMYMVEITMAVMHLNAGTIYTLNFYDNSSCVEIHITGKKTAKRVMILSK